MDSKEKITRTYASATKEGFKTFSVEKLMEDLKKLKDAAGEPVALILIPSFKGFDCFKLKASDARALLMNHTITKRGS